MKTPLVIILIAILCCCGEKPGGQTPSDPKTRSNRTLLLGIWWSSEMPQAAAFQVNDSTFYYPDQFVERRYELRGDSLFIFFEDGYVSSSAIVKLTTDTLMLSTDGVEQTLTRAEPGQ